MTTIPDAAVDTSAPVTGAPTTRTPATGTGIGARRPRPAPSRTSTDGGIPLLLVLAEVLLALITVVTVFGLRRVFLDTDWLAPLAVQVVAAHGLVAVLRRRGFGFAVSAAAVVTAGGLAMAWIYAGATTVVGIPTGETISVLSTAASDAITAFADVKAPTDALDGFLLAISAFIWIGALVSDWAAFRIDATIEATLPAGTLFVLTAILSADVDRVLIAGLWIATVLAFLLVRRADRLGRSAIWVGERRRAGPRNLVLAGVGLTLVAVVAAAIIGPRLPGARSDAVLSITDIGDSGPNSRVTVSPLIDIRSRLVDQADVEVFTVRSPVGQYWRLTSLDQFDGSIWSSNGSYGKADGDLESGEPVEAERTVIEQSFSIQALSQIWLPAAYEPETIQVATPIRYDEVSGTLIVDTEIPTSDNTDYRVTSAIPVLDPAPLATASTEIPTDIAERYLGLPDDFPAVVRQTAIDVTAGATNTYETALALQNFFRDNFVYDLDVGVGHGDDAITTFVTEDRRGYCEQFAGSFAAMARSLGIPARVAVGFTQGNNDPADPTLFRVRGEHAHAWPEVYLGQYGWVMFEPTPGRGAAATESYTGVPDQQVDSGGNPNTATTAPEVPAPTPTTDPNATAPTRPQQSADELDTTATGGTDDGGSPWLVRVVVAIATLLGVVGAYLLAVTTVLALRRRRRRTAAVDPDAQIALAWDESLRAVARTGVTVRAAETQSEVATRVGARLPAIEAPLATLAVAVEQSTYAAAPATDDDGTTALGLADEIETRANALLTPTERFVERYDPRTLRAKLRDRG